MTSVRGVERTRWTDEERAQLRRMHENGMSQRQMCAMLGRPKGSVHRQLGMLGLVRSDRNPVKAGDSGASPPSRAPKTTLPPLPSLQDWDGNDWPLPKDFWP